MSVLYSKLHFLVIFDLLFSRNGNSREAVFLLSSRSSELNLIRGECDLVMWQAGFAQHHRQHSSETGWAAGQGTLFPQHPHASACCISPRCACECLSRVCRWGLVEALPVLRQHGLLRRFPVNRYSQDPAAPDIQHQQPLCQQRPERKHHHDVGAELVAQLYGNESPSSAPGRGCEGWQGGILSLISLHLSCSPEQGTSSFPWLDCWFTVRVLWVTWKEEVWGCQEKRRNLHFWKVEGRTDFEMW